MSEAHRTRERVLAGATTGRTPRPEVTASWGRVRRAGLAPGAEPEVAPLDDAEVEARRTTSALAPLLPLLRSALDPVVDDGRLVVFSDVDGRVLWRHGTGSVRRLADRLGFVGGSAWTEANVGTNAIGTCLVEGTAVHIAGPEHYVESHTRWSCAAAPVRDPWTGALLGAVDVSGPDTTVPRSMLALVDTAARLAAAEVRQAHAERLDRLRAHAAPLLARLPGRALVVDTAGHVAAVTGGLAPDRLLLPAAADRATTWLPSLGAVVLEPLPGGWLVRVGAEEPAGATTVVLDLGGRRPVLRVTTASHTWEHAPSPRHTEILAELTRHRDGRSAAQLAAALLGDATRVVTVRAEMSRLRRRLGPLLEAQPYRWAACVTSHLEESVAPSAPAWP